MKLKSVWKLTRLPAIGLYTYVAHSRGEKLLYIKGSMNFFLLTCYSDTLSPKSVSAQNSNIQNRSRYSVYRDTTKSVPDSFHFIWHAIHIWSCYYLTFGVFYRIIGVEISGTKYEMAPVFCYAMYLGLCLVFIGRIRVTACH